VDPAQADLARIVDRCFTGSYELLARHQPSGQARWFGGGLAFTTGLPLAIFNGFVITGPLSPTELDGGLDLIDASGMAHHVWMHEDLEAALGERVVRRGRTRSSEPYPGMWIRAQAAPEPAPGVTVRLVGGPADYDDLLAVVSSGPSGDALARAVYPESFIADPDVRVFTGYLDGRPVGTSIAIRTGEAAGVYGVGTHQDARRRGVGTAVSWAAVAAGFDWGCEIVTLEASAMGEPIYRRMGFRTVVEYLQFDGAGRSPDPGRAGAAPG
jgi:GNAT superfamily N-acetyltransferase